MPKTAKKFIADKELFPTKLTTAELELLGPELAARALFSAQTTQIGYLEAIQNMLQVVLDPVSATETAPARQLNETEMRSNMQAYLKDIGYEPSPGAEGSLLDLSSDRRTALVIKTNIAQANGHAEAISGNRPAALRAFPALELTRFESREEPRDWFARWRMAGGPRMIGRKMIALKNSPVWSELSRWRRPTAPFDYNSGMNVRRVSRRVAIERGLLKPDEQIEPMEIPGFGPQGSPVDPLVKKGSPLAEKVSAILEKAKQKLAAKNDT